MNDTAESVVQAARLLGGSPLVVNTSGNLSQRNERGDIFITPSGVPYSELAVEDLIVLSESGERIDGWRTPSSETPLHLAVYRATTARAVAHTHSVFATTLSTLVDVVPPVHYQIAGLGWPLKVAPYATFGSEELASNTVHALDDRMAVLMQNHGAITLGSDAGDALRRSFTLEWLCQVAYHALVGGAPSTLNDHELARVADRQRAFSQSRARDIPPERRPSDGKPAAGGLNGETSR